MNKKGKSCGRFFWSKTSLPKTQTTAWQLYQFQLESIESLLLQGNRIISDFLLAGYAVNTGLVSLHPRVLGPWEGNEPFTEGKHKVKLDLGLDKSLREDESGRSSNRRKGLRRTHHPLKPPLQGRFICYTRGTSSSNNVYLGAIFQGTHFK
jgi:hypothetical protein